MSGVDSDISAASFFLADHAAVENGKVYASGAFWNRLHFPNFPATTHLGIVAVLTVPWRAYHQKHRFAIWFEDADAHRTSAELGGEFSVGTSPDMRVGDETMVPISAIANNFSFAGAGDYAAVLAVDGRPLARWRFRVLQKA